MGWEIKRIIRFNADVFLNHIIIDLQQKSQMATLQLKLLTFFLLLTIILAANDTNSTLPPPPDNTSNSTLPPPPPPDNATNSTAPPDNSTNSTLPPPDGSNSTLPPPANETNSTLPPPPANGTNSTLPPPPDGSNSTLPPPINGTNSTMPPPPNGTNSTLPPPINETNSTMPPPPNGTNSTLPPPANGTNSTLPPPANGTNSTLPPPANGTNSTMPPPANGTNSTLPPPANGTNSTMPPPANGTNSTLPPPPANGTNSTLPPPPANGTNSSPAAAGNVTFAPPPPINTTVVVVLNNSQADGLFIGSKRIQSLELSVIPANVSTNFRLNTYNRQFPNNIKAFNLNLPGNWSYVSGTRDTLSCSVIHEANRDIYSLLQFNSEAGSFGLLAQDILRYLTNQASVPVPTFAAAVKVLENCDGVYYNNVLYRLIPGSNNMTTVPVPSGWNSNSSPESLRYGIAGNVLYRFNPNATNLFTSIFTFSAYQAFEIRSYQGRLIVAAANRVNSTNATNTNRTALSQKIFVFNDSPSGLSLFGEFILTASFPQPTPIIPFITSPQLTKLAVIFPFSLNDPFAPSSLLLKSIDYNSLSFIDFIFQEKDRYLATIQNLRPDRVDFYLDDNYVVLRNGSANASGMANTSYVEEAYQMVGNKVIYLRNRLLTGKQLTDFRRLWIDSSYTNQLVVLDGFATPNGLQVNQFIYGSIASINKVVPPATPPFISFQIPPHTDQFLPKDFLTWFYLNSTGNSTNYTIMNADANSPNNLQVVNAAANGNMKVLTISGNCFIFVDTNTNNFTIAIAPPTNANTTNTTNPFTYHDLTPLVANMSINNQSQWRVSEQCDRLSINNRIFVRLPNQPRFVPVNNNMTLFTPSSLDIDLTAAVVGNSIWRFNPNTSNFVRAYDSPFPILPNSSISVADNKIVVTGTNSTVAQVLAFFVESSGNFTPCLNYYFPAYQNFPKIQISPLLTKVLILGPFIPPNRTQVEPKIDAFNIYYPNRTSQNISFNLNNLPEPTNTLIILDDNYVYVRSLAGQNGSNLTNGSNANSPQQNIYYIDQGITPKLAKSTNLTQDQMVSWRRSALAPNNDKKINILVESIGVGNNTNQVTVVMIQVTPQQANLNNNNDGGQTITGTVVDGKIKLCSPGCSDCSSGTCVGCLKGYAFDSTSSLCTKCGQNCVSCTSSNNLVCSSCIVGSYLSNSSTCLPCDKNCITCAGTPTNCTTCPPGQNNNGGICGGCPRNCISCANSTSCLTCNRGFVAVNGVCRGCSSSCSNCSATNITQCTSCAGGLNLINSACVSCPSNCQACNNGICTTCIPGFNPNSAGLCVPNCQISCATCADNQPFVCLSCYSGANLVGTTCQLDLSCNNNSTCTDCGQGLGYILVGANCIQCNSISNCLQCDPINSQQCSLCLNGYYINGSNLCSACNSNCTQCVSSDVCTACISGYTLADGQTQGQCLKCQSPCASCLGIPTYCTSCVSGFTKKGWKCQNNTYVQFNMTLNDDPANIMNNIDVIVQQLLRICGESTSNVDAVTFDRINTGSTLLTGSLTSSSNPATAASALTASLASNSFGNYTVLSASISAQGVTSDNPSDSTTNTGLIAGLVVGLSVLVVVIVVIGCVIYRKKQLQSQTQPLGTQDGEVVIELSNQEGVLISQPRNQPFSPEKGGVDPSHMDMMHQQQLSEVKNWEKQMMDH